MTQSQGGQAVSVLLIVAGAFMMIFGGYLLDATQLDITGGILITIGSLCCLYGTVFFILKKDKQ